jgi:ABC-2 type transport system ATP-binding protein
VPDAAIHVQGLRKSYGDSEAVRGIDFDVRRGEVFGLLGPNGAGKTTTVEILEGYRERTGGEVTVLGFDPGERSRALRARVGIVLQSTGLYRHVTVREAVAHFAGLYPRPRDVDEVIALVGLTSVADREIAELPTGTARRVELARALMTQPRMILLAEPMAGVAPTLALQLLEHVLELRATAGTTFLVIEHDMEAIMAISDRVIAMDEGRVVAVAPPDEIQRNERVIEAYLGRRVSAAEATAELGTTS